MNLKDYRVKPGTRVDLSEWDPADAAGLESKAEGKARLAEAQERLRDLQARLYAEDRRGLLIVLQGMDTAGKDGTIKRVMAGVNPVGCHVVPFKVPSAEERDHDFLWRVHKAAPRRGEVAIWNRSHYEDVLVVRVHELVAREVWEARYERINQFEQMLTDGGIVIVKFYLHISKDEQKERLQARLDDPAKHWKFNPGDLKERARWGDYRAAYEDALSRCSTDHAPWHIIPADRKWFRNVVVAETLVQTLEELDMKYPKPDFDPQSITID